MHIKDDHRIVSGRCLTGQADGRYNTFLLKLNDIYNRYNNMGANNGETSTANPKTESIFEQTSDKYGQQGDLSTSPKLSANTQ